MTIPLLPLPDDRLKISGFSFTEPDDRIVTSQPRGRPYERGGSTAAPSPVTAQTKFSTAYLAQVKKFYRTELGDERLFLLRDQQFDGEALLDHNFEPLLAVDSEPLIMTSWWVCQFQSPPGQTTDRTGLWIISFAFWVLQW